MGQVETKSAEQGRQEEEWIQKVINDLYYYKGYSEALEKVFKLLTNKNGK